MGWNNVKIDIWTHAVGKGCLLLNISSICIDVPKVVSIDLPLLHVP